MTETTHIIAILDRSGSMARLADEVITNFNHFLKEQKEIPGSAALTLVLFDGLYELVYDETDLMDVPELTAEQYYVRGSTAMYDALGRTLSEKKSLEKAVVFIHTDGHENDSTEWQASDVKDLITELQEKWDFVFAGANIDTMTEGASIGLLSTKTGNVSNDAAGVTRSYGMATAKATAYRTMGLAASDSIDLDTIQNFDDAIAAVNAVTDTENSKS